MIEINGAFGEGGGQILRSALALSLVTGKPFRITKIRAGRARPGLGRQHLTAVNAAAAVCGAEVSGNVIGSLVLDFSPGRVRPGNYRLDIGSAGSTVLVLQTILPALMLADGPSSLVLEGGTHNPLAPPYPFLELAFLPILRRMGARVEAKLLRAGFFPRGGGRIEVTIDPVRRLEPVSIREQGPCSAIEAMAVVSRLPKSIGERELLTIRTLLAGYPVFCRPVEELNSPGPGNAVCIIVLCAGITEVFTGFGERGLPAERVAEMAGQRVLDYLTAGAPVGPELADQLLLPMALAGGGGFLTTTPSLHTITNMEVIEAFLDIRIEQQEREGLCWLAVQPKKDSSLIPW